MTSSQQSAAARWSFRTMRSNPHMTGGAEHRLRPQGGTHAACGARRAGPPHRRHARLEQLLHRKPSELSGGQKAACCHGPRKMVRSARQSFLFDEPLSNLDAKLRIQMRLEIKRLHRELRTNQRFFP